MSNLTICSFNVRGIRDNKKRRKLFAFFHRHNFEIILLQETHSQHPDFRIWSNEWGGQILFSHGTNKSRGVAILFKPTFSYKILKVILDNNGRYIVASININSSDYILVNVYGPNMDIASTFRDIALHIHSLDDGPVIWGGDFNFV